MTVIPSLSIVIPVYNAEATLGDQLSALTASMDEDMELLVVDNRSTDGSRSVALKFAALCPQVRVVDAYERQGEPYARNVGVAAARSDAIAFCDADDIVGQTWAPAMRIALRTVEYVTGPIELDRLNPPWLAGVRGRRVFSELPHTVNSVPFAHGCNLGVRRATVEGVRGFDEQVRIGCDVDFAIRAHQAGVSLAWDDRAVVHYRHRRGVGDRWRQAKAYGRASHHLHEVAGVDDAFTRRVRRQSRRIGWLTVNVPRLANRELRTRWMWTVALVVGEIRGSER